MDRIAMEAPFDVGMNKTNNIKTVLFHLAKTMVILMVAVLISETLRYFNFGKQNLIMVYVLSVFIISRVTSGYAYGIVASVLSTFAYDFFITEPRLGFSFTIGFPITLCTMLLVTVSTSALTIQMKRQANIALEREQRMQLLYEINQKLLAARDLETIIKLTNDYLLGHVKRSVIFYTKDPLLPDSGVIAKSQFDRIEDVPFHADVERKVAHDVFYNPHYADSVYQKGNAVYYVPVVSKEITLGLIGVSCTEGRLDLPEVLFVQTLTGQVALALELQYLSDNQNRILVEAEREKMRATLLRAISHDLRTPLTSILGASSTVLEQRDRLDRETNDKLVLDIKENAQWLIRIVENLLSVTKISEEAMKLKKSLEAVEEVVAHAVSIVRKRFPDRHIHIGSTDELLLAPMEATLISQVIINLLENSIKNSPSESLILLDIKNLGSNVELSVSDTGHGIPDQLLDNLFEIHTFDRGQSVDSVSGMGIGLSICKTIVQAHGGTITGKNKQDGGAYFSFTLPLKEGEKVGT